MPDLHEDCPQFLSKPAKTRLKQGSQAEFQKSSIPVIHKNKRKYKELFVFCQALNTLRETAARNNRHRWLCQIGRDARSISDAVCLVSERRIILESSVGRIGAPTNCESLPCGKMRSLST